MSTFMEHIHRDTDVLLVLDGACRALPEEHQPGSSDVLAVRPTGGAEAPGGQVPSTSLGAEGPAG
jgi:hypothetical protein